MTQLLSATQIYSSFSQIKKSKPVIHSITNFVTMNLTANALLACGASPIMAHSPEEIDEILNFANSLVINIGTLDLTSAQSMKLAAIYARQNNKPVVLDPVGAGATKLRTETVIQLLATRAISALRGNASEILSLVNANSKSQGIDSVHLSIDAHDAAKNLAQSYDIVVCVSGKMDLIVSREATVKIYNGHPQMTQVTGMGCTATALIGAFLAVEENLFQATQSAMVVMGIAGELAAKSSPGPGSFQVQFLDALSQLDEHIIQKHIKTDIQ